MLKRLLVFVIALGAAGVGSIAMADGKLLLAHSYHEGYAWVQAINAGVREGLKGTSIELDIAYMDTKRHQKVPDMIKAGDRISARVEQFQPDVVLAADDNAQEYFAKRYVGKEKPAIVFLGVNAEPETYGYPADNVTGILERPLYAQTLEYLREVDPSVRSVALLGDDSETTALIMDYMMKQASPLKVVSSAQAGTLKEWKARVKEYRESADALLVVLYETVKQTSSEEGGTAVRVEPATVAAWTVANFDKPTASVFEFGVADGFLCGVVEDGVAHGRDAAAIALAILNGKKAGEIPITTLGQGRRALNLRTARAMGLTLPAGIIEQADKVFRE
jgi:ABC-type uncharacterized transport system substrate-binding protein